MVSSGRGIMQFTLSSTNIRLLGEGRSHRPSASFVDKARSLALHSVNSARSEQPAPGRAEPRGSIRRRGLGGLWEVSASTFVSMAVQISSQGRRNLLWV